MNGLFPLYGNEIQILSTYAKKHELNQGILSNCAEMRYWCELLLEDKGERVLSLLGNFKGVKDIKYACWALLKLEAPWDLIKRTEVIGSLRLKPWEEIDCGLFTRGHAAPKKAPEIWLTYGNRGALIMGQDYAFMRIRSGWEMEETLRPVEVHDLEEFYKVLDHLK